MNKYWDEQQEKGVKNFWVFELHSYKYCPKIKNGMQLKLFL